MAGDFLRSHGIDIDAEMSRIQLGGDALDGTAAWQEARETSQADQFKSGLQCITNVSLPNTEPESRWDVEIATNHVSSISSHASAVVGEEPAQRESYIDGHGALLAPSLCHPHVHLDKAFLLSHPKYADLQIERGDFAEAMELTGKAKALFEREDLLERGQRLIDESVAAGVTHMRAFVEVDAGVGLKCLEAGIELKKAAESAGRCYVQICAFAQLPLFSESRDDPEGKMIRGLMEDAAGRKEVDCVGSTPYVEADRGLMERNVQWLVELSGRMGVHLDFHLDYNLDPETKPMVWFVVAELKKQRWVEQAERQRTVVLGHCTRLTLFSDDEWRKLKDEIADLPISFVGLPTSDLFMMRTPDHTRGTLEVPRLIKEYGLNACMGINNIGNAFTPHGSCDPMTLACNGVGVYQAGTKQEADLLYECVSTRARAAIGLGRVQEGVDVGLEVKKGDRDLLLFGAEKEEWRTRKSVAEAVYLYDHCPDRRVIHEGKLVS